MKSWARRLLVVALVVVLLGAVGCLALQSDLQKARDDLEATRGELTRSQEDLATTRAELGQAREDLASLTQRVETLEGDFAATQNTLAQGQVAFEKIVADLSGEQASLRTTLTNATEDLSNARETLTEARKELSTLTSDFGALKNSFLLTRGDVAANQEALQTLEELGSQAIRYISVANLYTLMWFVNADEEVDPALAAVGIAVDATGDTELQSAWADWGDVFDLLVEGAIGEEAFIEVDDNLISLLRTRLLEALG